VAKKKKRKIQTDVEIPQFNRFDVVELTESPYDVRVILAEDLEHCHPDDEIWIIVQHLEDWDLVGSFLSTTEVLAQGPHRIGEAFETLPPRSQALMVAADLIDGDRNVSYGTPTQNFSNIAAYWNIQFGHLLKDGVRFAASHVAQANILQKMARMIAKPSPDNWIDVAGYAGCGYECDEADAA
jgi:hypothetical protein